MMDDTNFIGENLKKIRGEMDLSLTEVSGLTGVSKTMLSQIERGKSIPTMSTVWKIANGLKVTFATLLGQSDVMCEVKGLDDITPIMDDERLVQIYCVHPFSPLIGMEIFYGIFKPGCAYSAGNHKNGVAEHLFVYEGELKLVAGQYSYIIQAGNWISFDATLEHGYYNLSDREAKAHFVVTYA